MNRNKPFLQRALLYAFRFVEHFCGVVMDPTGLEQLNTRVLSYTNFTDRTKRLVTILWKYTIVPPYTVLRFIVNGSRFFTKQKAPSMGSLVKATDFFPTPKTRKLLKKMVADQGTQIEGLSNEGRFKTARWIWFSTWFLLVWYGCHNLVMTVAKAIRGRAA